MLRDIPELRAVEVSFMPVAGGVYGSEKRTRGVFISRGEDGIYEIVEKYQKGGREMKPKIIPVGEVYLDKERKRIARAEEFTLFLPTAKFNKKQAMSFFKNIIAQLDVGAIRITPEIRLFRRRYKLLRYAPPQYKSEPTEAILEYFQPHWGCYFRYFMGTPEDYKNIILPDK